jgi:hypothetical protein
VLHNVPITLLGILHSICWAQYHVLNLQLLLNGTATLSYAFLQCTSCSNNMLVPAVNYLPGHVVVEPCKRWRRCPVGLYGKAEVLCWAMASSYFDSRSASKICTPCFHTSRTSFPHPEFCYKMSMVCAMMACYVLEARVWKQWANSHPCTLFSVCSSRGSCWEKRPLHPTEPGRVVGEIALDQADCIDIQGCVC